MADEPKTPTPAENNPEPTIDPPVDTPPVTPETPQEDPVGEPTPPVSPEPEIDIVALKESITNEVREDVIGNIVSSLKPEDDDDQPPWIKDGRLMPRDDKELSDHIADVVEKRQDKKQEGIDAQKKEQEDQQATYAQQLEQQIEQQVTELRDEGLIPKVEDKESKDDPGLQAEKELYAQMIGYNEGAAKEGKRQIYSAVEFYHTKYQDPDKQPAGADAPIGGVGTTRASSGSGTEMSYEELHNTPYGTIINR